MEANIPSHADAALVIHLGDDDGLGAGAAAAAAAAAGVPVGAVGTLRNLVALSVGADPSWRASFDAARLHIGCRRPRAVRALLAFAGVDLSDRPVTWHVCSGTPSGRSPWFPVIDASRCTACGQCFHFCLFGVYGRRPDGRITVDHPLSCKQDCPACARICPAAAIIFPFCGERPIDGDEVGPGWSETVAVNLKERLGPDPMASLAARRKRPAVDPAAFARARSERARHAAADGRVGQP